MELWIRSQDKTKIAKIDYVCIGINDIFSDDDLAQIWGNDVISLGAYKTKERALEVLDEIQSKLKGTFLMKIKDDKYSKYIEDGKRYLEDLNGICVVTGDRCFDIEPINKDIYVYEMPKE